MTSGFQIACRQLADVVASHAPWINPGGVYRDVSRYARILSCDPHGVHAGFYDHDGDLVASCGIGCLEHTVPDDGPLQTVVIYMWGCEGEHAFTIGYAHPRLREVEWH